MTGPVKRYAVIGFGHKQLVEHEDGRYVLATDYARLEQERERLRGLLADVKADYTHAIHWEDLHSTMKRIDAALRAKP